MTKTKPTKEHKEYVGYEEREGPISDKREASQADLDHLFGKDRVQSRDKPKTLAGDTW